MGVSVVTLKLASGEQINAEVDDVVAIGVKPVGLGPKGEIDFKAALNVIKTAAVELRQAVAELSEVPETTELSFGLKLSASAGVILARAETEANFSIKIQWKRKAGSGA